MGVYVPFIVIKDTPVLIEKNGIAVPTGKIILKGKQIQVHGSRKLRFENGKIVDCTYIHPSWKNSPQPRKCVRSSDIMFKNEWYSSYSEEEKPITKKDAWTALIMFVISLAFLFTIFYVMSKGWKKGQEELIK